LPLLKTIVIAIDGPAGAGKSSTAKSVAERLGYCFIDTGAMYRAITLKFLRKNISLSQIEQLQRMLETTVVELRYENKQLFVLLDGEDVSKKIRSSAVTNAVSAVSAIPSVREKMVCEQQRMGKDGGVVLDGRDIGTVVFPNAQLKIFLLASLEARTVRRLKELHESGIAIEESTLREQIVLRDDTDASRALHPLKKAEDAVEIDTTAMTLDEVVDTIVQKAIEKIHAH